MKDLEIQLFEQLKIDIQAHFLKTHTPSSEEISKWKGIDIIYFQEDLRKITKGNISEKSFYTYFKSTPVNKIPRIDMLNILSNYIGFASWYEYKKVKQIELNHLPNHNANESNIIENNLDVLSELPKETKNEELQQDFSVLSNADLHLSNTNIQNVNEFEKQINISNYSDLNKKKKSSKKYIWSSIIGLISLFLGYLGFEDNIFLSKYTYCFIDYDRNTAVQSFLDIKVIKDNESPMYFRINPGECFVYSTRDKNLNMQISSPLYENLEIKRNLENAPSEEKIQLKPDDYKTAVYYFSKKDISGNPSEALALIKQKRRELENRISNNAIIYQVYDNDIYGIETMDKQKYITLVTTPTTSLKNLSYIEMKREKGKIVSIKFKINSNEK